VDKRVVEGILCRGKILDYLGMKIDYCRKGNVTFSMENHIKQILEEAPYDMEGIAKSPAACHLFNVNDGAKKLSEEKAHGSKTSLPLPENTTRHTDSCSFSMHQGKVP